MNHQSKHIIHRQIIELELNGNMSDEEIRDQYQQKLADEMMSSMETIFDGLSSENDNLIIDKLSLDLGDVTENEIIDAFQDELSNKLNRLIRSSTHSKSKTSSEIKNINKDHILYEDFFFYLKNGYMPWWNEVDNLKKLEEILEGQMEERDFISNLHEIFKNPDPRKRLVQQFSSGFNLKLLALLFPHFQILSEALMLKLSELILLQNRSMGYRSARAVVLENLWQILIRHDDDSKVVIHFQERVIASVIADLDLGIEEMAGQFPRIDVLLLKELIKLHQRTEKEEKADRQKGVTGEFTIRNSGLILLWPYLESLYKKLNLLNKDNLFLNDKMQERAVLISQYIVNGNTEIQEHQLILNKILHGWPIEKAVQGVLIINDQEQHILNEFLSAVIENWPVLKNSSTEALRESFLQREGRLGTKDKGWNLQVKRSSLDILLDNLPWPISIINLSWMRTIVYVKW